MHTILSDAIPRILFINHIQKCHHIHTVHWVFMKYLKDIIESFLCRILISKINFSKKFQKKWDFLIGKNKRVIPIKRGIILIDLNVLNKKIKKKFSKIIKLTIRRLWSKSQ
jgi:hypothetical protein